MCFFYYFENSFLLNISLSFFNLFLRFYNCFFIFKKFSHLLYKKDNYKIFKNDIFRKYSAFFSSFLLKRKVLWKKKKFFPDFYLNFFKDTGFGFIYLIDRDFHFFEK